VASAEILPLHLVRVGAPGVLGEDGRPDMVDVELELPGCIIVHHVDLGLDACRHLEKFGIIRRVFACPWRRVPPPATEVTCIAMIQNCRNHMVLLRTSAPVSGSELLFKELVKPDLDLIKQAEQGTRDRYGRFAKGRSGNPAGGTRRLG
jgi:hypothetical protein